MLYKEIPFVRFTLPLVLGICIGAGTFSIPFLPLILYSIICLGIAFYISHDRNGNIPYSLAILQFLAVVGYLLTKIAISEVSNSNLDNGMQLICLEYQPVANAKSTKVQARILKISKKDHIRKEDRIMIYFPTSSEIINHGPGDIIQLNLKPIPITDFNPDDDFNYEKYMLFRGYKYFSYAKSFISIDKRLVSLKFISLRIRENLVNKYSSGINDPRASSLVSALTLGYKESMDEDLVSVFRTAGISHIMAVSGLHVGIVSLIIGWLLSLLRLKNGLVMILLSITGIWIFALITGMTPSVSRASLMFTFLLVGKYSGRPVNPLNSLFASAFVLLIANPLTLFSVGFQLSYAAVLSILIFYKRLNKAVRFSGVLLSKTWSMLTVSFLAQIGTVPLVLYHFKQVPLLSIITNLFAIPLAFCILATGLLYLLVPSGFFISDFLSWLIEVETVLLFSVADFISSIPGSVIILNH